MMNGSDATSSKPPSNSPPPPGPTPFQSPQSVQNALYHAQERDPRLSMAYQAFPPVVPSSYGSSQQQQQQQQQQHAMTIYPMHQHQQYSMYNSYQPQAQQHQHQPQPRGAHPASPFMQAQALSAATGNTINPRLISPPLDAWSNNAQPSYFVSPPLGIGSPYMGRSQQQNAYQQPHSLFPSPELTLDGLGTSAPVATTSELAPRKQKPKADELTANKPGSSSSSTTNPKQSSSSSSNRKGSTAAAPRPTGPPSTASSDIVLLTGVNPQAPTTTARPSGGAAKTGTTGRARVTAAPIRRLGHKRKIVDRDLSDDDDEDDDDDDEDDLRGGRGQKLHKACSNCRKQKGKCVKKDTEDKCRMCRTRSLVCVFEPRPERKQPVQRRALQDDIARKDAIIKSLQQMLKLSMQANGSGAPFDNGPSSAGSDPSTGTHGEPIRRQVLEWLDKAEASRISNVDFASLGLGGAGVGVDGRAFNDSSDEDEADELVEEEEEATTSTTDNNDEPASSSRPNLPHRHSRATTGQLRRNTSAAAARASPRLTRTSAIPIHPVGLLAIASRRGQSRGGSSVADSHSHSQYHGSLNGVGTPGSTAGLGVANPEYFVSGDSYEAMRAKQLNLRRIEMDPGLSEEPKLLRKGLIDPDDVDKLFEIFYEKLNVTVCLLDPVLHTPETTFARCPLLFTVVCAVAARYFPDRPELYSIAMHFAMTSAAASLMDSKKSVELCQAYLLLSMWPLPSRKYDEDRAWLYLGLAIRMAMDLNLHLPTPVDIVNEQQEREVLNRTRTWIVCFNMDRTASAQLGKPMTIRENYMIRNSADWYKRSKFNHPYDLHLCQMTALMRIVSRFQDTVYADASTPSGVSEGLDLRETALKFDDEMVAWEKEAASLFAAESDPKDPGSIYRSQLLSFYVNYSRLVVLSFGFQYSFRMGLLTPNDDLVTRCLDAAQKVITKMIDANAMRSYLRYAPDSHLVFASFASAFLLKLLRQKFAHLLSESRRSKIITLVERLIKVLHDQTVSIDESHTPKIYGRFLAGLLQKHRAIASSPAGANQHRGGQEDTEMQQENGYNVQGHQTAGLSIDLGVVTQHQHRSGNQPFMSPLSPPSPHPSIVVTTPLIANHSFGYPLHDPTVAHANEVHPHNMRGEDMAMLGQLSNNTRTTSGSTVHPMDAMTCDADDSLLPSLQALSDPGPFWLHGMMPWPETSLPTGNWENEVMDHHFVSGFDG